MLESNTNIFGALSGSGQMSGTLSSSGQMSGTINVSGNIQAGISAASGGVFQMYNGSYDITPSVDSQTLATKDKLMSNNMVVEGIPYYETSNDYGYTVYIGSEVEIDGN